MQRRMLYSVFKNVCETNSVPPVLRQPIKFHDTYKSLKLPLAEEEKQSNQKNGTSTNENGDISDIFLVVVINGIRDDDTRLLVEVTGVREMAARVQFIVGHCHGVH